MAGVEDFIGQRLDWEQRQITKLDFALRGGDRELARLHVTRLTSEADAEAGDLRWTFHREGTFRNRRIGIRPEGSEADTATFKLAFWGGGSIELEPGRVVSLHATNFPQTQWMWYEVRNVPLIRYKRKATLMKWQAQVELTDSARG